MSTVNAASTDWYAQSLTESQSARVNSRNDYVSSDQFLQLLITQMTNQDPMNPMEDIDFTGQMAALQALDEQIKTNNVMTAMRVDTQVANVTSMIGKLVSGVDITGTNVSGVVKQAVVEDDVVYVETTTGLRIPANNVGKIWNKDVSKADELASAQATIGMYVGGKNADGKNIAGIVEGVTLDSSGNVTLMLHDGSQLAYDSVTDIASWYVDSGGDTVDLSTVKAMVGMYVGGDFESGGRGVGFVEGFAVDAEGKVWLELSGGERIEAAKVEQMGSKSFELEAEDGGSESGESENVDE